MCSKCHKSDNKKGKDCCPNFCCEPPLNFFTSFISMNCEGRPTHILTPTPALSDIDIVIHTPGTGAIMRTIQAPGSVSGGDCRGDYAADWQSFRVESSQVASGIGSTIAG